MTSLLSMPSPLPFTHPRLTHPPHPSKHLGPDEETSIKTQDVADLFKKAAAVGGAEHTPQTEGVWRSGTAAHDKTFVPSPLKRSQTARQGTMPDAVISLKDLPKDVAEKLAGYDIDGDGQISLSEVVHGAMQLQMSDQKVVFYKRMIIAIFCIWLLTMGAVFGVTYAAVTLSKETSVDDSSGEAKMTTADESFVVQTANSDFYIASDGSARVRSITSETYQSSGSSEDFTVMKTSPSSATVSFSSGMNMQINSCKLYDLCMRVNCIYTSLGHCRSGSLY
ncbi:hypothetical protein B484DRAFT_139716 [Ochromonadaceae sp. CCMP2298]|nr:hypothetical protein B484DRAFT_139716 [Ochromonadaceae sp. CCMP2298]